MGWNKRVDRSCHLLASRQVFKVCYPSEQQLDSLRLRLLPLIRLCSFTLEDCRKVCVLGELFSFCDKCSKFSMD